MLRFLSKFYQNFYCILNLILRFTREEAEVRKQALPFVPARTIRSFDDISGEIKEEVNF